MEWKIGPCAAFDLEVAGEDMNTTWGVSSNSGAGTRVCLHFSVGVGTGLELAVSAGVGMGMNNLLAAEGLGAACSWGKI